jgi:hypothetical protein
METRPVPEENAAEAIAVAPSGWLLTTTACIAAYCIPGLGHAILKKWDRAFVFFGRITILFVLGIQLQGKLVAPEFGDLFSTLKFAAEAGSGFPYWISLLKGIGGADPTAYTYDYANVFIYVAGLLNMLVIVDVFDIALGRKQ